MGARRAAKTRRPRRLWWAVLAAVAALVTASVVVSGLGSEPDQRPAATPTPTPTPTPVRDVDLSGLPIPRVRFCDLIGDSALPRALGGTVTKQAHYDSGDRAELAPGVTDVSHEYSCTFVGVTGAEARAWVFAAPMRPATAQPLVRQVSQAQGCRTVRGGPTYGHPSVTTLCAVHGPATQVTLRGLFGDAWFSCELTRPGRAEFRTRRLAEQWCVHVATTLGARP